MKKFWKWIQKYSWIITLLFGIINIIKEFKITNIMNYIWHLIQGMASYLNKLTVIQFIFIVSLGITIYVFIGNLFYRHNRRIKNIQEHRNQLDQKIEKKINALTDLYETVKKDLEHFDTRILELEKPAKIELLQKIMFPKKDGD